MNGSDPTAAIKLYALASSLAPISLGRQDEATACVALQDDEALLSITGRLKQYVPNADPSLAEWRAYDISP